MKILKCPIHLLFSKVFIKISTPISSVWDGSGYMFLQKHNRFIFEFLKNLWLWNTVIYLIFIAIFNVCAGVYCEIPIYSEYISVSGISELI